MDFDGFDALTFDCYGTLIDWETGILGGLRPLLAEHAWTGDDEEALELFGAVESGIQTERYRPYAEVLRLCVDRIADRVGFTPTEEERGSLLRSLGAWPAFPDTVEALAVLKAHYRLAVVSNVDDVLFSLSARHLGVEMDEVVTAEQVGSYKPAPAHFHRVVDRLGLPRERILHVAQSLFHDVAPARELGFTTVWVNRRGGRSGFGATPPSDASPDLEVPDLATLAGLVEGESKSPGPD